MPAASASGGCKRPSRRPRQRGFALLIVMWGLVLPALVCARVLSAGRMEAQLANNLRDAAVAEDAADGAVYRTIYNLIGAGEVRWPAQGQFRATMAGVPVEITVRNLTGRVNPNIASPELLEALFGRLDLDKAKAQALALAILEWRATGPRLLDAKTADYLRAGRVEAPPEKPFRSLDDLGSVLGMTPELLARLRPHLTLWWASDPDPAYADTAVLAAMRGAGIVLPASVATGGRANQAVEIQATAAGPGGARFSRTAEAVVNSAEGRSTWRIVSWREPGA